MNMKKQLVFLALFLFSGLLSTAMVADSTHRHQPSVELLKVWPEPFHDFLYFEFNVTDTSEHMVKIQIVNERHETVFMERVFVYEGHETITVSTIDFHIAGLYSIKITLDNRQRYLRKYKWQ